MKRGDFGPVKDVEAKVRERVALVRKPGGNRFLRRTLEGRYVEFNFLPLDDGGLLAFGRDVTSLKEREEALATAKEAAERARDDVERTREVMQTVLDNMSDGVTLWDKDFRWMFSNRFSADMWGYKIGTLTPGVSGFDMIRQLAEQGEFGPTDDIEKTVTEVTRRILRPGGARYEQPTASGKYIEFNFRPLSDGGVLGLYRDITTLKSREEALATAKEAAETRARCRREGARRGRGRQPGEIDLPRHHEPRDPHADERRARHDRRAAAPGSRRPAAAHGVDDPRFGAVAVAHHRRRARLLQDRGRPPRAGGDRILALRPDRGRRRHVPPAGDHQRAWRSTCEIDAGSDDALVGDPTRVRQVLFNLLGNALKFTERGRITLHAGTSPLGHGQTEVTISVADTGIGLSEEQRARLFQPFAQAELLDHATLRRHRARPLDRARALRS